MADAKSLQADLQRELDTLRMLREELDLHDTLARAEGRGPSELERELDLAQEEIDRLDAHSEHAFRSIDAARSRLDLVRRKFERLRGA